MKKIDLTEEELQALMQCINNGEAAVAFDPRSLATYVYPIESAAPESVRRWDAFWRLCSFCNRRRSSSE